MKYSSVNRIAFNHALNKAAISQGSKGLCVSPAGKGVTCYLAADGLSGFTLSGGYIGGVFSHASVSGRLSLMLATAEGIAQSQGHDVLTLDCFEPLALIYGRYGFKETERFPFNPEFAPEGWNEETMGRPAYVLMAKPIAAAAAIAA